MSDGEKEETESHEAEPEAQETPERRPRASGLLSARQVETVSQLIDMYKLYQIRFMFKV